jgi:SpoVK/Ycf46/Vps4 family AAA+-type ATPase
MGMGGMGGMGGFQNPMQIRFIVASVNPNQACIVTENTEITISPRAVEISEDSSDIPQVTYEDIGGLTDEVKKIREMVELPLKHPEIFIRLGVEPPKGVLLYGPPGCGKTFIAKATAGQVNAKFISVGLNDILDMWIGNSEKNLHEIFELARNNTPCVLFIDEIDALGASRSDMKQSSGRHLINQFLQELDGIESTNEGVLIIGATNTPWNLDPAFRRPGRFDRIVLVGTPNIDARYKIFKVHSKQIPVSLTKTELEDIKESIGTKSSE